MFGQAVAAIGQGLPWFWPLFGIALGGVTGSFLSCATSRLPHGQSLWSPPSRCDACHTRLRLPDLIPLLSWLVLRGRCRHCGTAYGAYNLRWEITCMAAGLLLALVGQPGMFTPLIISCGQLGGALLVCALWLPTARK